MHWNFAMARTYALLLFFLGLACVRSSPDWRVIRGYEAKPHEFPSIVNLQVAINGRTRPYCSGTLINSRTVLTAAHCKLSSSATIFAIAGAHQLSKITSDSGVQVAKVTKQIPHPRYSHTMSHDIMILKLNTNIYQSKTVKYVRHPPVLNQFPKASKDCFLVGWGKTSIHSSTSNILMKGPMTGIPGYHTDAFGTDLSKFFARPAGPNQSSGCKGDSGGPLYCPALDGGAPFQVGVVSGGDGICGSRSGLARFGRVSYVLDWLKRLS